MAEAPAYLVDKAANAIPAGTGWRSRRRWVLVPAFAALIVAAVVLLRSLRPEPSSASVAAHAIEKSRPPVSLLQSPSQPTEEQYARKLTPSVQMVEVLEPQPESVVLRENLQFRWKTVGNAAYYEVRVANSEGDLIWQGQPSSPAAQLPADLPLQPGKYFVWVRAYLHDGRTVKSDPVPFTVSK